MRSKRILAAIGLLLAGTAWPLVLNELTVGGRLARRADAAEVALLDAHHTRAQIAIAAEASAQFAAEAQKLERDLAAIRRLWHIRVDPDAALRELRVAAGGLGLEVVASQQRAARNGQAWREVPLEVTLKGPGCAVLELAERMERRVARTAVSRFHMSPTARPGVAQAELEIALLEPPNDPAPPGAR